MLIFGVLMFAKSMSTVLREVSSCAVSNSALLD